MNLTGFLFLYSLFIFSEIRGHVKKSRFKRVIGNRTSPPHNFPHQVSLVYKQINKSFCGGSFLSEEYVLTAAHCFFDKKTVFLNHSVAIVGGVIDLAGQSSTRVTADVEKVYVHRDFFLLKPNRIWIGDIAVLKLRMPVVFGRYLKALNLPQNLSWTFLHYSGMIGGFGADVVEKNENRTWTHKHSDEVMRYALMKVIGRKKCSESYKMNVTRKHICAIIDQRVDTVSKGLCKGDSGNALIVGIRIPMGVQSANMLSCDNTVTPAVMTRVTEYVDFIITAMIGKSDDSLTTNCLPGVPVSKCLDVLPEYNKSYPEGTCIVHKMCYYPLRT